MRVRSGLVHTAAWLGATAAAVSVSWFGVHRVLRDASFEQPQALVVAVAATTAAPSAPPLPTEIGTAVQTPSPSPSVAPTPSHTPSRTPARPSPPARTSPPPAPSPSPTASSDIQSFNRPGGHIAVAMGATSASLVSATPDAGWSMHLYNGDEWLRVDFVQGSTDSIFYVTWNGHPPMVQTS